MLRPSPLMLVMPAVLLLALGGHAASAQAGRAPEPSAVVAHAVPSPALLRQAHLLGRQDPAAPVGLVLTLPLRNQAALHALLRRLSDPQDPAYGHYLTGEQFNQQFAPTEADYQSVVDFAHAQGLTVNAHSGRTVVGVSGTSQTVESAFGVRLNRYRLPEGRIAYANDVAPQVPASIAARLDGIVGLDTLNQPKPHLRLPSAAQVLANAYGAPLGSAVLGNGPAGGLSPSDIRAVYNLKNVGLAGEGQRLGLVELGGYVLSDINTYSSQFGLGINAAGILSNVYIAGYDGSQDTSSSGAEAEIVLDIDMVLALAPKAQNIYVYESSNSSPNFLEVITQVADDDVAQSVSCSFGLAETVIEAESLPSVYQATFNAENAALVKMAAQGQSFFTSAGDAGGFDDGVNISVDDPANQPYATAVGGTSLSVTNGGTANIAYSGETTWNGGAGRAGGGGTSIFFLKPYYQYANPAPVNPTRPLGASATMRDLPDVSLNADPNTGYDIYVSRINSNSFFTVGGTSAAAPLWAAYAALVNEARATGGTTTPAANPGPPAQSLGFANPLIYEIGVGKFGSYANDFHDITSGNNLVYSAAAGFDDATGWGSFNGGNLLADLAAAGNAAFTGTAGHTFPAGLALVSVPSDLTGLNLSFAQLFGLPTPVPANEQLILWQPAMSAYAYSPSAPADTVRPGVGYWLRVPVSSGAIALTQTGSAVASPFTLTLQKGWNQIGDPFPAALPFADISVTPAAGGSAMPLTQASTLASPVLYAYRVGATAYTQETSQLLPYAGYWFYARAPLTLTFTAPS